jgi:hypothetical protein
MISRNLLPRNRPSEIEMESVASESIVIDGTETRRTTRPIVTAIATATATAIGMGTGAAGEAIIITTAAKATVAERNVTRTGTVTVDTDESATTMTMSTDISDRGANIIMRRRATADIMRTATHTRRATPRKTFRFPTRRSP